MLGSWFECLLREALVDWMIGWLSFWLIACMVDVLIDWWALVGDLYFFGHLIDWLIA